ncbi:MAG: hypothetical protein AB7G44_05265 [Bacteroidia bacterium]
MNKTNTSLRWRFFSARSNLLSLLLILFLAVFTFPEFDPVIGTGLDQGYVFCFNYFFNQGISHGSDAIFSYGPFGFIRFPLLIGNNYLLTFCFTFAFQLLFVWLVFQATKHIKQKGIWLAVIAALLLSANLRIDEKMMGCVAFALVLHAATRKNQFLFIAIAVTALSFFVKLNIAAASVMMAASYLVLDFIRNRKLNNLLLTVGIGFSIYFLLWLAINHNLDGSLLHLRNWFFISNGNLGATSVNAPNDKIILSLMLIFIAGYCYLFRSENVNSVYVIFAFALWAVFRYSIAREENHHAMAFFNFLILFGGVLFLADEKIGGLRIAILIAIPYLYYQNIKQTGHFHMEWKMKYGGITNFKRAVNIFRDGGEEFNKQSQQNLANVLLADSARKIIADNTVDIFPWETSYVVANNLNYRNRPLFQLGCVNNAVLDKVNADFLQSEKAPLYYIWTKQNWWGQEMSSIDFRYVLSDDGQVNFSILNNYAQIYEDEKVRILKRTEKEKLAVEKFNHANTINWNEWTPIPELTNGTALRMKFNIVRTLVGKLKHSFYKEPEYYMLYQLHNDSIKKHRLVVQNTESGIWAAPYLTEYNDSLIGEKVKAIKFVYTDREFVYKPQFGVEWEQIRLK